MFLTHLTDAITTFITNLYSTTGLAGIVLAMAIESCCIPLPSEIVMPLAGVMFFQGHILAGVNPVLGLVLIALAGSIGCLIGSIVAYGIGYSGGRPLLLKYGRYVLISQHDADRADAFFKRWGSATAFFSRLLPVVRTYISLPAGIAQMPFVKFCVFTFLGSFPWCLLLSFVGYKLGQNLSSLSTVFHGLDVVIILAIIILVALYIWRHIRNDRKARAALAAEAAEVLAQNGWNQQSQQLGWGQPQQTTQPQQTWGQSPPSPSQSEWGQQPQPSGWGQPQQPQQSGWGQQPQPPSGWGQPQQPPQGWGQPVAPAPQPQGWGQPAQQGQPGWNQQPPQQGWPSPNSSDDLNRQRR